MSAFSALALEISSPSPHFTLSSWPCVQYIRFPPTVVISQNGLSERKSQLPATPMTLLSRRKYSAFSKSDSPSPRKTTTSALLCFSIASNIFPVLPCESESTKILTKSLPAVLLPAKEHKFIIYDKRWYCNEQPKQSISRRNSASRLKP